MNSVLLFGLSYKLWPVMFIKMKICRMEFARLAEQFKCQMLLGLDVNIMLLLLINCSALVPVIQNPIQFAIGPWIRARDNECRGKKMCPVSIISVNIFLEKQQIFVCHHSLRGTKQDRIKSHCLLKPLKCYLLSHLFHCQP